MAQFKKGNPGKPKGAENKTTKEAKALVMQLVSEGLDKAKERLNAIEDPKEYLDTLAKFISYVIPKQTHAAIETEQNIVWNETRTYEAGVDLKRLSDEELNTWIALAEKAQGIEPPLHLRA